MMHAYLFVGQEENILPEIKKITSSLNLKATNKRQFELKKVDDVKKLIRETNFSFKEKTVYILKDFDNASVVAQNAFLKRLEEPQQNLTFILTAKNESSILDTILSRCLVKDLGFAKNKSDTDTLWSKDINQMLETADKIKSRDEAINLLENMLVSSDKEAKKLKHVLETLVRIKANANFGLQLTNLIVKLK